jgi:hypothetical protein
MGAIAPSKMPKGKTIVRKDNPDDVTMYKEGGKVATKNWIAGAIKKPGALRKELGVKEGKTIPAKKLAAAAKKPGTLGKRARLAETLKGMKK